MFFFNYLRDIFQLILAPVKGWEDIAIDDYDSRRLLTKGFIPFIIVASMTVFIKAFYHSDASIVILLQQSIVCFLKYFASYFLAAFVFTLYLPTCIEGELSMQRCLTFVIYGLGLLALINIVKNCIPVELAIVFVMPIYALYILWRGLQYMNISFNGVGIFILLIIFGLLMPPYLLQYLFNLILPEF